MQTTNESRRILELLAQGKITVDEADALLRTAERMRSEPVEGGGERPRRRWMRITLDKEPRNGRPPKQVTIRVPASFLRSGARLGAMIPWMSGAAPTQRSTEPWTDVDWSAFDFAEIEAALADAGETTIDSGSAHIRIAYE
jgi:hypothetical protein